MAWYTCRQLFNTKSSVNMVYPRVTFGTVDSDYFSNHR